MEHEGVGVGAKLSDNKRNAMDHEPANEADISAEPVELGNEDRAFRSARTHKCRREFGPPF